MDALARLAATHGVATSYAPAPGESVEVPRETVLAVLRALGVDAEGPDAISAALARGAADAGRLLPPTLVGSPSRPLAPPAVPTGTELRLVTENGERGPLAAAPPPVGRHTLHARAPDGRTATATVLVPPDSAPLARRREVGLMVQLYSLLSRRSWGMGDLGDLADLASWAGSVGGVGFLQLNPLHAAVPPAEGEAVDPSPYRPATRRFADPVHLRIEAVPEFGYLDPGARERIEPLLARAATLRRAVLDERLPIDRDAVWAVKRAALEILREVPLSPGRAAAFHRFVDSCGRSLTDHATWCALAERHGPDWHRWPPGLRRPDSPETEAARVEHAALVDFHRWLAWLTDTQLAGAQRAATDAGMGIGLLHDLAVGVHPDGSDAWAGQDVLAGGMSVGAPPDAFNERGQDWGLPPWRPDALAETGYAPYLELAGALARHAGGLRVDHVMGQFRLWWIPEGAEPRDGTYVAYDADAMLAVLSLAAHRAGAVLVGEDLGTVEPGVRERLAERGVAGTSVLWFERHWDRAGHPPLEPAEWRTNCLATVTTHDLPATAARWDGSDVRLRERLGLLADPAGAAAESEAELADWLETFERMGLLGPAGSSGAGATGESGDAVEEEERIAAAYRFLALTPARLVGVWLPDAVGDRRPQNVPGTWREYPNWRLPVADATGRPVTLEELTASGRLARLLAAARDRGP
ncbi:4-alpha-glucanotransferase [Streptomyces sp. 3MP-14]|uniref:4-alpha-glucanotransferase n=1 Tax=Streptomyces mimosae TaxID=2586635 RepID=A0A5N6AN81_9ACTN|nr:MULTISPECIES: 4-alpha-glucanotransferase [Streptomyces]KAB8169675.1 4-alpha-glucanotransferase [Streptomyces mimosae]KAB8178423.1 4-alpha-glucanotransferase [Streptomyces sp. 3MP-14]